MYGILWGTIDLRRSWRGSGGSDCDIVPGRPEKSILVYRMDSLVPGIMMPELGRGLIDSAGVKLISDYISLLGN